MSVLVEFIRNTTTHFSPGKIDWANLSASFRQVARYQYSVPAWLGSSLVMVGAFWLWYTSLPLVDLSQMQDTGLVSVLPWAYYLSLVLLTISFVLNVYQPRLPDQLFLAQVTLLIIIIHSTPTLLYGTLRYSWAWKHLGVVDYIQRHGQVNQTITFLDAYHNWPGFFTLSAFITEVAGFNSPLTFASWAPVYFNLLNLGAVFLIYRALTPDRRLMWFSIWIYFLTGWVGQDYYSPQALNFFLHLIIIGICLNWLHLFSLPAKDTIQRFLRVQWITSLFWGLLNKSTQKEVSHDVFLMGLRGRLLIYLLLIFAVIASSHQLTPFMTLASVTALVLFQQTNARLLPIIMGLVVGLWLLVGAYDFMEDEVASLITGLGKLSENVDSSLLNLAEVSLGQKLVSLMGRGLVLLLWGLAFLGGLRRFWLKYWDLSPALLAIIPFMTLAGNSYGGELLFRVYLFSLPFMCFFAAALIYPQPKVGKSGWSVVFTWLLTLLLLTGFLFAYYGKEKQYYFTPDEVAASEFLYSTAPPNSLLIEGSRNYPMQFKNYENFYYVPISRERRPAQQEILANPEKVFTRWMTNDRFDQAYIIITRSQKEEINAVGAMPFRALESMENTLLASPDFVVIFNTPDAKIFTLADHVRQQ